MSTPNFTKGIGRLVTDRYDFEKHLEGQNPANATNFRHKADQVDIVNPGSVYGNPSTVELALEDLNAFVNTQISAGQGFVAVGDGYNTWHNANGTINFDTTVPALDTLLNPIFSAIVSGSPLPAAFQRIKYGGIVLIKAGTYIIKNTVLVPPGIMLIGEGYGTKIINATSLDTSTVPPQPKLSPTPAAVFSILADPNRASDDAAVDPNMFVFSRETAIAHMIISDNFVEPTALGDTFYKLPQNKTSATALNPPALVSQQLGSSLTMNGVIATGRVNFSSGTIVSQATGTFWAIDNSTADTETFCKLDNCFIDGFSVPFDGYSSVNAQDYLEIKNSKVRSYGYFNGDSTDGYYNTIIKSRAQNMNIVGSYFNGNALNITSLVYMFFSNTSINKQTRSKVVISNNQVVINKTSNISNTTWHPIYFAPTFVQNILSPISPNTVVSSLIYGNSFQDVFDLYINEGAGTTMSGLNSPNMSITQSNITLNSGGSVNINGNTTFGGNVLVDGYQLQLAGPGTTFSVDTNTATTMSLNNGSSITMQSGSILNGNPGSTIVLLQGSEISASQGSILILDGYVMYGTHLISSDYVCDTYGPNWSDYFIFVDSSAATRSITLPLATGGNVGRMIAVKDFVGSAGTHSITINAQIGQSIDSVPGEVINTPYGSMTFVSGGTKWLLIAKI